MDTIKDRLNNLYQQYELKSEDVFKSPQGWTIITRTGIDKIMAKSGIRINYDTVVVERDFVVLKAIGTTTDGKTIETFGEANNGQGKPNCRQPYPVAMAEKRAMARVILKLTGFYELGIFSEDESDDFKDFANKQRLK